MFRTTHAGASGADSVSVMRTNLPGDGGNAI
jgi:hypothetical protein